MNMFVKGCVITLTAVSTVSLGGCAAFGGGRQTHSSSSLVGFLYPNNEVPPLENQIPELRLPLRVGLAFLPSAYGYSAAGLEAGRREALLESIRQRFTSRKFIAEISIIPDYYLKNARGFDGLQSVQRLYNVDVMALVSYDQVTYRDENKLSLGYLTIVGAYVLPGSRHEVTTLVDLAVIDPTTRSILLRAGGTDARHNTTTLVDEDRKARQSQGEGFTVATAQLIDNFDQALTTFETSVREGKANVKVLHKQKDGSYAAGGGGALDAVWLVVLAGGLLVARRRLLLKRPAGSVQTPV